MMPLLIALGSLAANACAPQDWKEGGLYSVEGENGGYSIVKILRIDAEGVHIRLYSNHFSARPSDVDISTLYMPE